jgi:co-chaperonin GroES (HSP10)
VVEEIFNENKTASGLDLSGIVDANEKKRWVVSVGNNAQNSDGSFTLKEGDSNFSTNSK